MVKVSIKKNVKPKTVKQKQKQSQKTNVTVNIGSDIIKKKRGRPPKKSKIEKQKPASQQPIIQSYNQPIFKQSTPPASSVAGMQPQQLSNLASSILASQNTPKVVKEEIKEESALKKALTEQSLQTEEPITKANDLERVRVERIKKVGKPKIEILKDEPIRYALLSQMLSDQQDDTEELQQILVKPKPVKLDLTPISTTLKQPAVNPLTSFSPSIEPALLSQENKEPDLFTLLNNRSQEPITQEEELVVEDEEIPENALINQQQEPPTTILEETESPPTIIESLEPVRQADQYTTEQLVKDEIPTAQASLVSVMRSKQIESKWKELHKKGGPLEDIVGGSRRMSDILLDEINSVEPSWAPTPTGKRPGKVATPKKPEPILEESVKKKRGRPPKRNDLVEEI